MHNDDDPRTPKKFFCFPFNQRTNNPADVVQRQRFLPTSAFSTPAPVQRVVKPNLALSKGDQLPHQEIFRSNAYTQVFPASTHATHIHVAPSRASSQIPSLGVIDNDSDDLDDADPHVSVDDDQDQEDQDLSELMNRRMREAKMIKAQLAQERKTSAYLRDQLSASQTQLTSLETLASSLRADFHSKESQLLVVSESEKTAKSHIQTLEDKLRVLEEKLATSETRIDKVKEAAQTGVKGLERGYEELMKDMKRLREEGGEAGTKKVLGQLREEAEGLRKGVRDGLEDIQACFDPSGRRLLKCEETRGLVRELENERNDAHQVIDLLRNKLHLQSTQLAECQQCINDLEQTRKEESKTLMKSVGVWEETGKRVEEVVEWIGGAQEREKERGVEREKERERLVFESKLEEAIERNKVLEGEVNKKKEESEKVRKENETIYARCEKLDEICKAHEQCSPKYDAVQATIQEREEEIVILREHVREWKEKKEIADASLEKCQTRMTALESRLCKSVESEAVLRTQADYALEKVKALEGEVARSKNVEGEKEEERKGLRERLSILQERFDAQTMTIKLVKEHSGDLQEWLVQSEKTHAATLEQVNAKFTAELAISEEQKATLRTTISDLKQGLENTHLTLDLVFKEKATLESALSASRTTVAVLEAENESVKDKLGRYEKEVEKLESMGRKLDSEMEIGKEQTRVLESALNKSIQDLETLRSECMTSRTELGTAKSERAGLDIVLEEVKGERDGLREEVLGLRKETARLEGAIELSKREAGRMVEVTVGEMEAKIGVLTEKNKILQGEQEREKGEKEEEEENKEGDKKLKLKIEGLERLLKGLSGMMKRQVDKTEKVYEDRIKAELDKAGIAEMGLEGALRLSQELEQRVKGLQEEVKLKAGTKMDEKVGDSEMCRELTERISELEGEIQKLEERAGTLGARYKVGDLNDSEKAFVDSLMGVSQAMYEQDIVDKDNELRRRDNMNQTLQTKIHALETTLAKFLKDNAEGKNTAPSKSMIDPSSSMLSNPLTSANENSKLPRSPPFTTAYNDGINDKIHDVDEWVKPKPPQVTFATRSNSAHIPGSERKTKRTFASLEREEEDISDYDDDDDVPLTKLVKRSKPSASVHDKENDWDHPMSTRRSKTSSRKGEKGAEKVDTTKSKPNSKAKKRR